MTKVVTNMLGKKITISDETWEQIRNGTEWTSPEQIEKFVEDQRKEEAVRKTKLKEEEELFVKGQAKYWKENPEREEFILQKHSEMLDAVSDPYDIDAYKEEILVMLRKTWDAGQLSGMKQLIKLDRSLNKNVGTIRAQKKAEKDKS